MPSDGFWQVALPYVRQKPAAGPAIAMSSPSPRGHLGDVRGSPGRWRTVPMRQATRNMPFRRDALCAPAARLLVGPGAVRRVAKVGSLHAVRIGAPRWAGVASQRLRTSAVTSVTMTFATVCHSLRDTACTTGRVVACRQRVQASAQRNTTHNSSLPPDCFLHVPRTTGACWLAPVLRCRTVCLRFAYSTKRDEKMMSKWFWMHSCRLTPLS